MTDGQIWRLPGVFSEDSKPRLVGGYGFYLLVFPYITDPHAHIPTLVAAFSRDGNQYQLVTPEELEQYQKKLAERGIETSGYDKFYENLRRNLVARASEEK